MLSLVSDITSKALESAYTALGSSIARNPKRYIAGGFLMYLVFLPGMFMLNGDTKVLWLRLATNFLTEFSIQGTVYWDDYVHASGIFPEDRGNAFIMSPGDEGLMTVEFLQAAQDIEKIVKQDLQAEYDGAAVGFEDLCVRRAAAGPCEWLGLLSLLAVDPVWLAGVPGMSGAALAQRLLENAAVPQRALLPLLVGGATVAWPGAGAPTSELAAWLASGKSMIASFQLREGEASQAFELRVQDCIEERRGDVGTLRLSGYLHTSIGTECANMAIGSLWLITLTIFVMIGYAVTWLATQTRKPGNSQVLVIISIAPLPGIASFAGIGLCGYVGVQLNVLSLLAPFLALATGIDALFVIVSSLKNVGPEADTPEAISRAVANGGSAITLTGGTSVLAFALASVTSLNFPGFAAFNFLLSLSIFLSNVGMLLIVPALLVLNENRIDAGRQDLRPWRLRAESSTTMLSRYDPAPRLRQLIVSRYAPLVESSMVFKIVGVAIFIACVGAGAALVKDVSRGMPDRYFVTDGSYVNDFMDDVEVYFGNLAAQDVGVLLESPAIGDPAYRRALADLVADLDARSDTELVDCWLAPVLSSLSDSAGPSEALTAVSSFLESSAGLPYQWTARFSDAGDLQAVRCRAFVWQPADAERRAEQAQQLLALGAASVTRPTIYHISFPVHVGRFESLRAEVFRTVGYACLAVLVALLFVLPAHVALVAFLNISSVLLTVFGFMVIADISANAVTYTSCVMAVGFCVDYTCHVCHAAVHGVHGGAEPWSARMRRSIETCGYDVFHGCMTALLGVFMLIFADSAGFRIWSLVCMCITVIGGTFALVTLPAIASSVSYLCGGQGKQEQEAPESTTATEPTAAEPPPSSDDGAGACKAALADEAAATGAAVGEDETEVITV